MQWIAYFSYDDKEPLPVATGASRQEAISLAITRTLCRGVVDGAIGAQQRDDVPNDVFRLLTDNLDKHFADKGAPSLVGSR